VWERRRVHVNFYILPFRTKPNAVNYVEMITCENVIYIHNEDKDKGKDKDKDKDRSW